MMATCADVFSFPAFPPCARNPRSSQSSQSQCHQFRRPAVRANLAHAVGNHEEESGVYVLHAVDSEVRREFPLAD